MTKGEKRAKIKEWVAAQEKRGSPYVRFEHGKAVVKFSTNVEGAYTAIPDIAAMLVWLDGRAVEKRLLAMIDASPEPGFAISTGEREQRLKEIKRDLLILERQEEALITAAEERGQTIPRRIVADPRAVLGLVVKGLWRQPKAA